LVEKILDLVRTIKGRDATLVEAIQKDLSATLAKGKLVKECYQLISQKLLPVLDKSPCW
jgi:hypothetical protein